MEVGNYGPLVLVGFRRFRVLFNILKMDSGSGKILIQNGFIVT